MPAQDGSPMFGLCSHRGGATAESWHTRKDLIQVGKYARRPVSRVLFRLAAAMTIPLGRLSPGASRDRPGRRPGNRLPVLRPACRPYLVLLRVGFAMPRLLPGARCALTAPFHPCLTAEAGRRFAFCCTVPGVAPAGRYPAPLLPWSPDFPRPAGEPADRGHPAVWRALGKRYDRLRQRKGQRRSTAISR